jgi:hypothetical protein
MVEFGDFAQKPVRQVALLHEVRKQPSSLRCGRDSVADLVHFPIPPAPRTITW